MRLSKALVWAKGPLGDLQRLAVEIGYAIQRAEVEPLRVVRTELALVIDAKALDLESFESGYRLAMRDVLAAHEHAIRGEWHTKFYDQAVRRVEQAKFLVGEVRRSWKT
jgi:hypothetical protein